MFYKNEILAFKKEKGKLISSNNGFIAIDLGLYFPFLDPAFLSFRFEGAEDCNFIIPSDYVTNHRYPNKNYITVTQKLGKKLSKTGYILTAPIDKLNSIKYLVIYAGPEDAVRVYKFKIKISLNKEHPYAIFNGRIKINDFGKSTFYFNTYYRVKLGWKINSYYTNMEEYMKSSDKKKTLLRKNSVLSEKSLSLNVYEEPIVLVSLAEDEI